MPRFFPGLCIKVIAEPGSGLVPIWAHEAIFMQTFHMPRGLAPEALIVGTLLFQYDPQQVDPPNRGRYSLLHYGEISTVKDDYESIVATDHWATTILTQAKVKGREFEPNAQYVRFRIDPDQRDYIGLRELLVGDEVVPIESNFGDIWPQHEPSVTNALREEGLATPFSFVSAAVKIPAAKSDTPRRYFTRMIFSTSSAIDYEPGAYRAIFPGSGPEVMIGSVVSIIQGLGKNSPSREFLRDRVKSFGPQVLKGPSPVYDLAMVEEPGSCQYDIWRGEEVLKDKPTLELAINNGNGDGAAKRQMRVNCFSPRGENFKIEIGATVLPPTIIGQTLLKGIVEEFSVDDDEKTEVALVTLIDEHGHEDSRIMSADRLRQDGVGEEKDEFELEVTELRYGDGTQQVQTIIKKT